MKFFSNLVLTFCLLPFALSAAELVSFNAAGTDSANMESTDASEDSTQLIAGNRYLVFRSDASDFGPVDTNGDTDIYLRDLQTDTIELISVNSADTDSGNGGSFGAAISDDGRYVVFNSSASDLVATDTNGTTDLFIRDRDTDTTRLISKNVAATDSANDSSSTFDMTPDGQWVVYSSYASDLVATDTNANSDIFLYSTMADSVSLVSINLAGTDSGNGGSELERPHVITNDGRYIVFGSTASDLITTDANGFRDVFLRDLMSGTTTRISEDSMNVGFTGNSGTAVISADGSRIAFGSFGANVTALPDANGTGDYFAYEVSSGDIEMITVNAAGTAAGTGGSDASDVRISDDGRYFAFESGKTDLVNLTDTNGVRDAFLRDLETGVTTLLSRRADGTATANDLSKNIQINHDASVVVYQAGASDIVTDTDNNGMGTDDVFVYLRQTGMNYLVSANASDSGSGNGRSWDPILSVDGSLVYFNSEASDLDASIADTNTASDVYLVRVADVLPAPADDDDSSGGGGGSINPLWLLMLILSTMLPGRNKNPIPAKT
ncbi:MAG: hypothetical protein AAF353_08740 [Pseudomonadota bacterium]